MKLRKTQTIQIQELGFLQREYHLNAITTHYNHTIKRFVPKNEPQELYSAGILVDSMGISLAYGVLQCDTLLNQANLMTYP
jgi:hypothetical protein